MKNLLICVLVIGCMVWFFYSTKTTKLSDSYVEQESSVGKRDQKKQNLQVNANHSIAIVDPQPAKSHKSAKNSIHQISTKAQTFHDLVNYPEYEKKQSILLEELGHDDAMVLRFTGYLTDIHEVQSLFPKDHSQVRLLGMAVISKLHQEGFSEPLETVIHSLCGNLLKNEPQKGQQYDLVDGLSAYLRGISIEDLLDNPDILFSKFPYGPRLKDSYARALNYAYGQNPKKNALARVLMPYLNS